MFEQRIEFSPSLTLAATIGATHAGAAALLWIVDLPLAVKAALALAIAISFVYFMARDAFLRAPHSVVALQLKEDGRIAARTRAGHWLDCEVMGTSYVSSRLTVVNLRARERRLGVRVVLVGDNVGPEAFRRLRTWLRWQVAAGDPLQGEAKNLTK